MSSSDFALAEMLHFDEAEEDDADPPLEDPELSMGYFEGDMMIQANDEERVKYFYLLLILMLIFNHL